MLQSTVESPDRVHPRAEGLSTARRAYLDALVERARLAAAASTQQSQADCDRITRALVIRGLEAAQQLAVLAVQETKIGVIEDKAVKNMIATEFVFHAIKDVKSVGIIGEDPERNLKTVAEPVGVVLGVTPVTNPTATVLFKSLMVAKTRNAIIFCPHPHARACSIEAARLMAEAGRAAGAPDGFITWVEDIEQPDTEYLMHHPGVSLIDATGGPGMVRAAYSSGKPALGVGAGNVPCYVHRSADLRMAVIDILTSKTFDNGTACASEQTVIVDRPVYDEMLRLFAEMGAHVCTADEVALLARTVVDPVRGRMQPMAVGQSAVRIAQEIGLQVPPETKLLLAPLAGVGRAHPLSCEKLFPVLGILPVDSEDEALNAALDVLYFGGVGHTASIFSTDAALIDRYAATINAGRIIVNSPSSVGALGGVYNDLTPTLSFGCGTGGGNSTIENVTVKHYLNLKSVAARTPAHQWFRAPNQIYFNQHALENLRDLPTRNALIVTSKDLDDLGLVETVRAHLPAGVPVHVFDRVEIEPTYRVVADGVAAIRYQRPDHLIAVGGGSVLDAAKAMRLFYQHPDLDFRSLATTFLDPRKRVIEYPHDHGRALTLVAVPTTSGTGSEVTPFAVITDEERGRKVPLYDHSLIPDIAILDPELVRGLPPSVTADTGLDALTHALEAVVSVFASEYTDALALQAARLVFEYLPRAVRDGGDLEARTRLHNAACMAGLAFANAFVGVNHALAHSLGARFHLPHGRANAVLLPYVVRYNASLPSKFMPFPNVTAYVAPAKYAAVTAAMNWGGASVEERVDILVRRIIALLDECHLPTTIAAAGVARADFEAALPEVIQTACDDISLRSNPRMPLLHELEAILRRAYDGPPA
ncbi:MAG TPA: bifunctional acetaldehyde-CoA/alcohol dehydrogenase [Candidatus Dormibacteraeota bacterium]|nr:bifunctional acetaldehyde-CoA/alcohol dehydrogenase [Candidatus Dormibacteraeota bacterium]